ncbi:MAG: hypothetical protein EOO61_19130, partial [Hymenobacter sp.]
ASALPKKVSLLPTEGSVLPSAGSTLPSVGSRLTFLGSALAGAPSRLAFAGSRLGKQPPSFALHLAPTPMLERLRIQNFKSWQDTGDMAFGSLTGFFGTNSSGKSSILQFLLMLKQTVESSDRSRVLHLGDDKSYVDLGTMYDILFMHEDPGTLKFEFQWSADYSFFIGIDDDYVNERKGPYYFEAEIIRTGDNVKLSKFNYRHKNKSTGIRLLAQPIYSLLYEDYELFHIIDNKKILGASTSSLKFYNAPHFININFDEINKNYSSEKLPYELENLFTRMEYLGPLREYPNRLYVWAGEQTRSVGSRGEWAIAALLSSRNRYPTIDMGKDQPKRTVEEHVAHWLKELGLIYSFKVQPIAPNRKEYEVRIQRTAESASVFLTDVGFGVSQILPVLVLLFY